MLAYIPYMDPMGNILQNPVINVFVFLMDMYRVFLVIPALFAWCFGTFYVP